MALGAFFLGAFFFRKQEGKEKGKSFEKTLTPRRKPRCFWVIPWFVFWSF
jgi:hypothetical protein